MKYIHVLLGVPMMIISSGGADGAAGSVGHTSSARKAADLRP